MHEWSRACINMCRRGVVGDPRSFCPKGNKLKMCEARIIARLDLCWVTDRDGFGQVSKYKYNV